MWLLVHFHPSGALRYLDRWFWLDVHVPPFFVAIRTEPACRTQGNKNFSMKKFLLATAMIFSITAFTQNVSDPDQARIKSNKIKSVTQTVFPYKFDVSSKTVKPVTTGIKFSTQSYDVRGNVIEEISYDRFGNVDVKTKYKYDSQNHQVEIATYNSADILQSKVVANYNSDTLKGMKYYDGNNNLTGTGYADVLYDTTDDGYRRKTTTVYFGKDSTIAGAISITYDKQGRTTDSANYKGLYLDNYCLFEYDSKNEITKQTFYNNAGNVTYGQAFKYDANGNMTEMQTLGDGWLIEMRFVYKFDTHGNFTEATKYDRQGKPVELYKYGYAYYQ